MGAKKIISSIILIVCVCLILVLLLDLYSAFEIKSQISKYLVYFGSLLFLIATLIFGSTKIKSLKGKLLSYLIAVLVLLGVFHVGPFKLITITTVWKTQEVIYQHGHFGFRKVEFQMKDLGALGYKRRTVEVLYISDWFMLVSPVIADIGDRVEWVRVDQEVNELGLKYP